MKNTTREIYARALTAAALLLLSACVAVQPFPQAARAGDTITLAVGSPDDLKQSNMTVTYVPDNAPGTSIDLTPNIVSIFKLYPDKTSNAWLNQSTSIAPWSGHGAWMSIVALNLPSSMPTGTGKVYIAPGAAVYPINAHSVTGVAISMEILPGSGAPNPLQYLPYSFSTQPSVGRLSWLKPSPQVVVRMPRGTGYASDVSYAAIEIRVRVQMQDTNSAPLTDDNIAVVFDDQSQHLGSRMAPTWSRNGDEFVVTFISPVGGMQPYETRFSILPLPGQGTIVGTPSLTSVKYFDVNGNPVSGPALELVSAL